MGVSLPPQDYSYLALFCAAHNITQSKILKKLIEDWIWKQRRKNPEIDLIRSVAMRFQKAYELQKQMYPELTLDVYKKAIMQELIQKFSPAFIIEIYKYIKDETSKH